MVAIGLFFGFYLINVVRCGTFSVSIAEIFIKFFITDGCAFILPIIGYVFTKITGYVVTDEGIGIVAASKNVMKATCFVKWEDITALKYKRYVFFGTHLVIYSDKDIGRKRKSFVVNRSQRKFKEIVDIVSEKTNLPIENEETL